MNFATLRSTAIILLMSTFMLTGCSADSGSGKERDEHSADYQQQNLKGTIGGVEWECVTGRVFSDGEASRHSFELISSKDDNVCKNWALEPDDEAIVMFGVSDENFKEQRMGLALNTQTVTLSKRIDGNFENYVASDGFIELTAVEEGRVTGKMVATFDGENKVSGDFEVVHCCKDPETGRNLVCGTESAYAL
jgi:hypothetical protein